MRAVLDWDSRTVHISISVRMMDRREAPNDITWRFSSDDDVRQHTYYLYVASYEWNHSRLYSRLWIRHTNRTHSWWMRTSWQFPYNPHFPPYCPSSLRDQSVRPLTLEMIPFVSFFNGGSKCKWYVSFLDVNRPHASADAIWFACSNFRWWRSSSWVDIERSWDGGRGFWLYTYS